MNAIVKTTCGQFVAASTRPQTFPFGCVNILVADDEPLICQLYTELLVDSGYKADTAENGAVAWNALKRNDYDLLITDNEMPQVSGVELLKKIQDARMALPVIMVSGTMPTEELEQYPGLRLDGALLKPFNITEFVDLVKKVLHAVGRVTNSAQLFRDCAMNEKKIPSRAEKPAHAAARDQINPPRRILVVDDDNEVRQLNIKVLTGFGYAVEGVKDGFAGWEALQTCDYDLVITDNKMPRMTGVEMISKLRAAAMAVPVIMATGNIPTHEFIRRPWLKPEATLQKPFSNNDLVATVRKVLYPNEGFQEQPAPR